MLKDRAEEGGASRCVGNINRTMQLPTALVMDMMRIACEAARLRPSVEGIARLVEALELLSESQWTGLKAPGLPGLPNGNSTSELIVSQSQPAVPHFPLVALRRFAEAARRARQDFEEWRWWREVSQLIPPLKSLDEELWRSKLLPFLEPKDSALRECDEHGYLVTVDAQLNIAAERCRRTLS